MATIRMFAQKNTVSVENLNNDVKLPLVVHIYSKENNVDTFYFLPASRYYRNTGI
jgi:hypothetical protein